MSEPNHIDGKTRCAWATTHPLLGAYHDTEWGIPVHDERLLFEMLNLEGAQAGLSWLTILKKRDRYREIFANFEIAALLELDVAYQEQALLDPGIVRNKLKIKSVFTNAQATLNIQQEGDSLDAYMWRFVHHQPLSFQQHEQGVLVSERMSQDLQKRGFKFVGPTICFAFMQAVGLIQDHEPTCYRSQEISSL